MGCQTKKGSRPIKYETSLRPTIPNAINARVGIDLIGPLPLTENARCQYLCVMIDYFSKWPEAIPIRNKSAESVARAIYLGWYCRHGIPFEIHTDQGPEFTNDLLRKINARMGVEARFTTPYNPQSNGEVERFNRTLINSLSAYVTHNPGTWDKYLHGALFAYRTTVHPATGETPFFLMHGREARIPLDVIRSSAPKLLEDIQQFKSKLTVDLQRAYEIVRDKLMENAISMKRKWDAHTRDPETFADGERVLMYHPQVNRESNEAPHSQKFKGHWRGPYEIIAKRFDAEGSIYKVKDLETNREFSVNANKLRKISSQTLSLKDPDLPSNPRVGSRPESDGTDTQTEVATPNVPVSPDHESAVETDKSEARKVQELPPSKKDYSQRKRSRGKRSQQTLDANDFEESPVEKIVEHSRSRNGRILYRVRWEGHGPERDQWLPLEAFYTRECLEDYWRKAICPDSEVPRAFRFLRLASTQVKRLTLRVKKPQSRRKGK
jgi:hypothetical protein